MSKAEIAKQVINNKDLLDFTEDKPVREYSKEPPKSDKLDFKKKASMFHLHDTRIKLEHSDNDKISNEQYLSNMVEHLNQLKEDFSNRLSVQIDP